MKTNNGTQASATKKRNPRFLTIFVCISLSVILFFGVVLVTVTLINRSRYVVSFDGYGITEEVAVCLASEYKYRYIVTNGLAKVESFSDTPAFWERVVPGDTKTYGDYLREGFEQYLKEVVIAGALFSAYTSYTSKDKAKVNDAIAAVMATRGIDGVKANFNKATAVYGFDYDAFCDTAKLKYMAASARSILYGEIVAADCEVYLATYTHVKLLFVNDAQISLGEGTIREDIAALDAAVIDGSVSPQMFENLMKYNSVKGLSENGEYYLHESSSTTAKLYDEGFEEVVLAAIEAEVGGFAKASYPNGTCYIYKYAPTVGAYADSTLSVFFDDFGIDASNYLFGELLASLSGEVKIKDEVGLIDIVNIPYNYTYRTEF